MLKKKKSKIDKINTEFQELIRETTEKFFHYMNDYIENRLDDVDSKFQEIIQCEKQCDRIKERYVEILFQEKRALPFLVEDRYKIVSSIDKILNKIEYIARFMQVYPFKINADVNENLMQLNKLIFDGVNQLMNCALLMETNFDAAYLITFEVEKARRQAHDLKFKILDIIFKKKRESGEALRISLTTKLIDLLYDVIQWVEQISDYLRGLIIKYPNR
jgi:predicted phosphate transport protein (TIGR00153 family)